MKPTVAIDWDGTVVEHKWPEMGDWLPGAKDALRKLTRRADVLIHSCRANSEWGYGEIRRMLDAVGLRDVKIWTGEGKPIAMIYIDDRAYTFEQWDGDALPAALNAIREFERGQR